MDATEFEPLAEIEVEEARVDRAGFTLTGHGLDRAEYRLGMHFDMPLDARTRQVLGELLTHAELTVARRAAAGRVRRSGARP